MVAASPIHFSREELELSSILIPIQTIAVNDNGRRVYFGQHESRDRHRLNLAVLSLDTTGNRVGEIRRYADSNNFILPFASTVDIRKITISAAYQKLYLVFNQLEDGRLQSRGLTVYDLDLEGEPIGQPRTYIHAYPFRYKDRNLRLANIVEAIAIHPDRPLLYLSGSGFEGVGIYNLDSNGEPQGEIEYYEVPDISNGATEIRIGNNKLYLGTQPNKLVIIQLDKDGLPTNQIVSQSVTPSALLPTLYQSNNYFYFHYTPKALYWLQPSAVDPLAPTPNYQIGCLLLDSTGNPIGSPVTLTQTNGTPFQTQTLAVDSSGDTIWITTSETIRDAIGTKPTAVGFVQSQLSIQNDGSIVLVDSSAAVYGQNAFLTAVPPGQVPFVFTRDLSEISGYIAPNEVNDYQLVLTPEISSNDNIPSDLNIQLKIFGTEVVPWNFSQTFTQGDSLQPIILDLLQYVDKQKILRVALENKSGQYACQVTFTNLNPLSNTSISLQVDVFQGKTLVKQLPTDSVQGNRICFLLPGYVFLPPGQRETQIEWLSQHVQNVYLPTAQAVVPVTERPQKFTISCYTFIGGQGHEQQLRDQAKAVSLLGINSVNVDYWQAIPPDAIKEILDAHGLTKQLTAYGLPAVAGIPDRDKNAYQYFDFVYQDQQLSDALKQRPDLAKTLVASLSGAEPKDVTVFQITDEPAWFYPDAIARLNTTPTWLANFRSYLEKEKGLDLAFFKPLDWDDAVQGQWGWDQVLATADNNPNNPLPLRRLFYWSVRYFTESAARGHKLYYDELVKVFTNAAIYVNWNNFTSQWYTKSPNVRLGNNNPNLGSNAGYGYFDWLDVGRTNAFTPWSEDWFYDYQAQEWSFRADLLRSAAMLRQGNHNFGGHIVGEKLRKIGSSFLPMPASASYRALALIGRGAKVIDFYAFGPSFLFPANCWSDFPNTYGTIAKATQLIGKAESLLFAGQPLRGQVALLIPNASPLWDADSKDTYYLKEVQYLHLALIHAGYTVDFVDEIDLRNGALAIRGYAALYITSPNIDEVAQAMVATWVAAGGMLVATLGAGVADRYNTAIGTLDVVLGLQSRQANRDIDLSAGFIPPKSELETLSTFGGKIGISSPLQVLQPSGSDVSTIGTFSTGAVAITSHRYGDGTAIAYGFFPGWQYWISKFLENPIFDNPYHLPQWGKVERDMIVAPVRLAHPPRLVELSHEVVEACWLESSAGIAIVLLNWTGVPIPALTITVPDVRLFTKSAKLADGAMINQKFETNPANNQTTLTVVVRMAYVDVLMIE
jgi:hypothetical protein